VEEEERRDLCCNTRSLTENEVRFSINRNERSTFRTQPSAVLFACDFVKRNQLVASLLRARFKESCLFSYVLDTHTPWFESLSDDSAVEGSSSCYAHVQFAVCSERSTYGNLAGN
jgi:hypothetical protein